MPILLLIGSALAGSQISDISNYFSPETPETKASGLNITPLNVVLVGAGAFMFVKAFKLIK